MFVNKLMKRHSLSHLLQQLISEYWGLSSQPSKVFYCCCFGLCIFSLISWREESSCKVKERIRLKGSSTCGHGKNSSYLKISLAEGRAKHILPLCFQDSDHRGEPPRELLCRQLKRTVSALFGARLSPLFSPKIKQRQTTEQTKLMG